MQINDKYFGNNSNQMSAIDDVLDNGEKILWRGSPNKASYIGANILKMMPFALLWLAIDCTIIFGMFLADDFPQDMLWFIIPFFAIHLTPVWIWIANIVKAVAEIKNIEYAITDRRVIIKSGAIGVDFKFVSHTDIDSINVKIGFVDKICHVGDVYINSKSSAVVLFDLQEPNFVANNLQKLSFDVKRDAQSGNDMPPNQDDGFGTVYTDSTFDK